jgi:hypothetical protein
VDGRVGRDKASGLPWNLVTTPLPELVKSSSRGPDFNEKHHPYCGLLSSMHTYGLFNGRYGLSDKIFIQMVGPEHRPAIEDMLAREVGRQDRLKAKLAADPATASWVSDAHLFANYKLLQFFDTLALYFNCTHEAARGSSAFANVPKTVGEDVTVTVSRLEKATYRVAPYPFQTEGLEVRWAYRNATPQDESVDMPAYLAQLPIHEEVVRLVP